MAMAYTKRQKGGASGVKLEDQGSRSLGGPAESGRPGATPVATCRDIKLQDQVPLFPLSGSPLLVEALRVSPPWKGSVLEASGSLLLSGGARWRGVGKCASCAQGRGRVGSGGGWGQGGRR